MQTSESKNHLYITADVESEVISDGIEVISSIRNRVEEETGTSLPIVWFVRFQRNWTHTVEPKDPDFFRTPLVQEYDGFQLAKEQLLALAKRGDEIAWHYHAYNYVYNNHLSHDQKIKILEADLETCANTIKAKHPEFEIVGFRFGWFFIPDYSLFPLLYKLGIRYDCSYCEGKKDKPIPGYDAIRYSEQPPEADLFKEFHYFPVMKSPFVHDWTVVPYTSSWGNTTADEAVSGQQKFYQQLIKAAEKVGEGHRCLTYKKLCEEQNRQ